MRIPARYAAGIEYVCAAAILVAAVFGGLGLGKAIKTIFG